MVTFNIRNFFLLLAALSVIQANGQNHAAVSVLSIEQTRFDAMTKRDTVALQTLLADDLVYIHSNALKETKKEHIHAIASGKIVYQFMGREEATVRFYGKTALSSGALKVKGTVNGNPFDIRMLYTAVYRKKKPGWQLVNWQSTRVP